MGKNSFDMIKMKSVALSVLLGIIALAQAAPAVSDTATEYSCPDGFDVYGEYCYKFSANHEKEDWATAQNTCLSWDPNAHLARPKTEDIDNFIVLSIEKTKDDFWFDLNDINREYNMKYTDGSKPDYTHWADHEPDNGGRLVCLYDCNQDCTEYDKSMDYFWN